MRRRAVIGVATATAVMAIAGLAAWWLLARAPGPDAAAASFLSALADREGGAAADLLASPVDDDTVAAFQAATATISDPQVTGVSTTAAGSARAEVSFELDGTAYDVEIGLVETADGWRVSDDALGTLTATAELGDTVVTGTVLVPTGTPAPLLPAAYELSASPADLLDGSAHAVVLPGRAVDVAVPAALSSAATANAQTQIDAYADACAVRAVSVPDHCGLVIPWPADLAALDSIAFRIEDYPQIAFADDASTFSATGGAIVATATGTAPSGDVASFTYRTDGWALRGSVRFTGDEMELSVR